MTSKLKLHPDNDVLERYSLGHLSGSELENVEVHLFACESCQDELALVDSFIADLKEGCRTIRNQPEPERIGWLGRLFTLPRLASAGAFAAVALLVGLPLARQSPAVGTRVVVQLETYREGPAGTAVAEARHPLHLNFRLSTVSASGSYHVDIVNAKGSRVWTGTASGIGAEVSVDTRASFAPGLYWVRVYDAGNAPPREYGLRLK